MNRRLVFDLARCRFSDRRDDILLLGLGGTGKSYLGRALEHAAILQGDGMLYREAHVLLEELTQVPLLIIDDFGMRKLPQTTAENLLEIVMRRYERASTLLTPNRVVVDWENC